MKKVTDAQLDQQIKAANERLEKLQQQSTSQAPRGALWSNNDSRAGILVTP